MKPINNRSMPSCTIIPVLGYKDVSSAIDWLCRTFGFAERWRAGNHRAQLTFENGCIAVTESKHAVVAQPFSLMVRVADVESHYKTAMAHGAKPMHPPTEFPYGEKQYSVADIGGYVWTFSQSVKDMLPEEWGGTSGAAL